MLALGASGCTLVTVTAATAGSVAAAAVSTAGKVTVATVKTGGKLAASAVSTSGDVTSLTIESAARLARTGVVVAVDAGTGAVTELPWRDGMQLGMALQSGRLGGGYHTARVFRSGAVYPVSLGNQAGAVSDWRLQSRDVVELLR